MVSVHDVKWLNFPEMGDDRGQLVVIEGNRNIPFEIKRIFYMYDSDSEAIRGKHANERTEFVFINVSGSCKVKVIDSQKNEIVYELNKPQQGLYLPNKLWKEMYDFSENSVLLVLASEHYDSKEYIRDFKEYTNEEDVNM